MQAQRIHSECGSPVLDSEIEDMRAVIETPSAYWPRLRDWVNASTDPEVQRDRQLVLMLCRPKAFYPVGRQASKILRLKVRAEASIFDAWCKQPDFDLLTLEAIFEGGVKIADWRKDGNPHPTNAKGIYLIVWNKQPPVHFEEIGSGSHCMGDPNVPIKTLEENWLPEPCVLYIGKAAEKKKGLRGRLNQYMRFGDGKSSPHWGGRYIWQLRERGELLIYWKELPNEEPRDVERLLLQEFKKQYGRLPFANLKT